MNVKRLSIVIAIFTLLIAGSVSTASTNNNSSYDIKTASFNDGEAASVDIVFVGTSDTASGVLTETSAGLYDVVSAESTLFLLMKINLTGYTTWKDTLNDTGVLDADTKTVGQLDLIIDNTIATVGNGYASSSGATILLQGYGAHTVTFLYSNMKADGTFVYASDSVTVRVSAADDFTAYAVEELDVISNVTDAAVAGETIERQGVYWDPSWEEYYRDTTLTVENDAEVYGVKTDDDEPVKSLVITGEIDSTGTIDNANDSSVTSTVGHVFLVDATGVSLLEAGATEYKATVRAGSEDTFVGLLVLGDGGIYTYGSDFQQITKSASGDTVMDFSFDFYTAISGGFIQESSYGVIEAPGFELLSAIFTIAFIAFVIPRKFRK